MRTAHRRMCRPERRASVVGPRGVGKTVPLERLREDAESADAQTVAIEAPEGRSLPGLLAPELRLILLRLSHNAQAKALARRVWPAPQPIQYRGCKTITVRCCCSPPAWCLRPPWRAR